MSSRVLKKLQGPEDLVVAADDDEYLEEEDDDDDDDEDVARSGKPNSLNPFDLLNQQSFSESEVKEDDNETEHASTAANVTSPSVPKKKKRKRKKKSKYTGNYISSEDNELTDKYLSDMDSLVSKVYDGAKAIPKTSSRAPVLEAEKSLLAVELRNLNPQNEMRRTFGKRVVKMENKRGRQKLTLKSTHMVTPKESWPPVTKNFITMKVISPPSEPTAATAATAATVAISSNAACAQSAGNHGHWFTFEHSNFYQKVQHLFLSAVERTDTEFLINLIRRYPYHVDSLIQLSDLCKMTEDFSLAGELVQRAVLVLETALHPSFNLTSGNCRLDYRRQENRAFFIVLFKHAQYLEARACCRTAFETAKLVLSLNPDSDPLAIVLVLDYYALRSKQYHWLIKYYEQFDVSRNLSQLPNMAYSYALSLFYVHGDSEKANSALQYALLMFPSVVRPLLEELSVPPNKRVESSPYFKTDVGANQPPALHQLVCLYNCRAKVVWRQSNILQWLDSNVNAALDRIERNDPIIEEYSKKRAARYVAPPRAILRHVILSDYKEKVPLAPFLSKEKVPILTYDPLAPPDSINCYERKSSSSSPTNVQNGSVSMFFQSLLPSFNFANVDQQQQQQQQHQQQQQQQQQPLLPQQPLGEANRQIAAVGAGAAGGGGGGGGAGGGGGFFGAGAGIPAALAGNNEMVAEVDRHLQALNLDLENIEAEGAAVNMEQVATYRELTQSFTNIVDAMRDFLQNFHIAEHLQTAGDNEENGNTGNTDDESSDDENA